MSKVELECPGCGKTLQLDKAFVGGVCRCSHCGMLMSVPEHPGLKVQKEIDVAVERPDVPVAAAAPVEQKAAVTATPHEAAGESHAVGVVVLSLIILVVVAAIIVGAIYFGS